MAVFTLHFRHFFGHSFIVQQIKRNESQHRNWDIKDLSYCSVSSSDVRGGNLAFNTDRDEKTL